MEIKADFTKRTHFSPWTWKVVPFQDQGPNGQTVMIPPGSSLPEIARSYYGNISVHPIEGNYPFLDRDHKERNYYPAEEDPFVMNHDGVEVFKREARIVVDQLIQLWKSLDLPLKHDDLRRLEVPDTDAALDILATGKHNENLWRAASFLASNIDIALKFCVVRGVPPGWWTASYAGQMTADPHAFRGSIDSLAEATRIIRSKPAFAKVKEKFMLANGDPLYSNVGYPLFQATRTKEGIPLSRLQVLQIFDGVGTQNWNWSKVVDEVDKRGSRIFKKGFPFAVSSIRRSQYGLKPAPAFKETSAGLMSQAHYYGYNTTRVAFVVPYLFNLYLTPLSLDLKAVRWFIPGAYNDGEIFRNRTQWLKKGKWYMAEGDYSNYDRTMPYPLIMDKFRKVYNDSPHFNYWHDMLNYSFGSLPLIWPDYLPGMKGRGYVFRPGVMGLLSGMKPTSEIGTEANVIMNCQSLLDSGIMNQTKLVKYLTQYATGTPPGSLHEFFFVNSDDALLVTKDREALVAYGKAFQDVAKKAGVKLKFSLGDRYLMRHMESGRNVPVLARIWQNTLSNEQPVDDPLKFLVGLASRTDGILGIKTIDPFGTGKHMAITNLERVVTLIFLESLERCIKRARSPIPKSLELLDILIRAAKTNPSTDMYAEWRAPALLIGRLNEIRSNAVKALAHREVELLRASIAENEFEGDNYAFMRPKALDTLFMELRSNPYSPSSAATLEELVHEAPEYEDALRVAGEVEHKFFRMAMRKVNIPIEL